MLRDNVVDRFKTVDGITYSYDPTRSEWLSVGRYNIPYSINHRNISTSRWLVVSHGIYSNNIGFKMSGDGTITKATVQAKSLTTCKFIVKGLGDAIILQVELDNESYKVVGTDTDFGSGDSLRCYVEVEEGNKVDYPFVVLECASRTDL